MEFRNVKMGEICEIVTDYVANGSFKSLAENVKYCDEGYARLIRLVDYNNRFEKKDSIWVSKESYEFLKKSKLKGGEIIITNVGANLGTVFLAPTLDYPQTLGPNSIMIKTKEYDKFVYYLLLSNYGQSKIKEIVSGSAMPKFNKTDFKQIEIKIPTIEEQTKIVKILENIDQKIELNNQINDNLFEILNKLFIHDYLENDEYNSWNSVTMNDITSRFATGLNPRKNFVLGHGNNYYVTIKNIPNNRVILDSKCDKVDDDAIKKINKRSDLKKGDVLFSGIGTIGRTYLIKETPKNWNISESVFTIRPNENISSEFLYLLVLSRDMQNYAISKASGSVQKGIRMADLKLYKLKLPPKEWMENFTEKTASIIDKIYLNYAENEILATLRNTLLPKLMNGEIDLDKIEI